MQATHVIDTNWMGAKVWSNGLVYDSIGNNTLRVRELTTGEVVYTSDFSDLLKISTEQKIAISPNGKRVYIFNPDSNAKTGPVIIDIEKDTKILLDKKFRRAKFITNDELTVITRVDDDYDTCIINTAGEFVRNTRELESYSDFSLSFGPIRILGYSGPYGRGSGYNMYDDRKPTASRTPKVIVANEYMGKFEKVNPSFLAATSFNDKTYIIDMKTNLVRDTIEARTSAYPSTKYTGFLCDGYTFAMYYDSQFTAKVDLYDLRKKAIVKTINLVDIDLKKERVNELVPLMHRMGFCLNIHIKGKGDLVRVYNLGVQPGVVYEEINGLSWRRIYSDGSILTDATFYNPSSPDINNIINLASRNDIISDQASLENYLNRMIKCMAAEVGLY